MRERERERKRERERGRENERERERQACCMSDLDEDGSRLFNQMLVRTAFELCNFIL